MACFAASMHNPCQSQDKAVKRYSVRNMVDSGAMNDLKAACVYEGTFAWRIVVWRKCFASELFPQLR